MHVGWCPPDAVLLRSRYVTRVHTLPAFSPTSDAWKRAFVELCQRERFDLVIPTNDPTIIPLQEHRRDVEPYAKIYLLNDRAFEVGYDKLEELRGLQPGRRPRAEDQDPADPRRSGRRAARLPAAPSS